MLSVNPIARVVVNNVRASVSPTAFDTGLLLIEDAGFAGERRLQAADSSAAAIAFLSSWGFAETSEPYKSAVRYFGASPAAVRLLLSCYPPSETPEEALAAVLDRTASFYGVAVAQAETDARLLALDSFVCGLDRPLVCFFPVSGAAATVTDAGGLLDTLYTRASGRAFPFYCTSPSDAAAVMGTAMGLEAGHKASAFSLCYKTVQGLRPSDLTEAQASMIKAKNGNVYLARGYTHLLLEKGTVASGLRYDEVLYTDQIASALQDAAVTLLAENPDKLPQTDDSTAQFVNRFTSVLMSFTDRGILASGSWRGADTGPLSAGDTVENGFALWADSYDDQSDADRAAHKAVPVNAALLLAGSVESIVVTVNVMA